MTLNESVNGWFLGAYNEIMQNVPADFKIIPPLVLLGVTIAVYSIFVWFLYRALAKKDILEINLAKYNKFKHSALIKIFATIFYIIKFIIIMPLIILFLFVFFTIILIVLAKEYSVPTIMLISAAIISAIRMTAYFNEDLSKDLAKMFPFTLLGIAILTPGFFNLETTIARFSEIPLLFNSLIYYYAFIVVLEIILRVLYLPVAFFSREED